MLFRNNKTTDIGEVLVPNTQDGEEFIIVYFSFELSKAKKSQCVIGDCDDIEALL